VTILVRVLAATVVAVIPWLVVELPSTREPLRPDPWQGRRADAVADPVGRSDAASASAPAAPHRFDRWASTVSPPAEPGEFLAVGAGEPLPPALVAEGFRVVEVMTLPHLAMRVHRLRASSAAAATATRERLQRILASTAVVDANHRFEIAGGSGLPASHARALIGWDRVPADCGRSVRLAMIDAPVDARHPALIGAEVEYRAFTTPGRRPAAADHGTAVAAMLVGRAGAGGGWGGLLPGASLTAAGIFEITETGTMVASERGLLAAVDWIVGGRPDVVNLSIAGPDNRVVEHAVQRARLKGAVLVAAAGNGGEEGGPAYPAAYADVIAVTAVGRDRRIYEHASRGPYVQFAAPGVGIWTAVPSGGRFQSGTSFASPFVAAMAGLAIDGGVAREPEALRSHLRQGAVDLGPPGRDPIYGWGLPAMRPACPGGPAGRDQGSSPPRPSTRTK
jgi:hypothetical protein